MKVASLRYISNKTGELFYEEPVNIDNIPYGWAMSRAFLWDVSVYAVDDDGDVTPVAFA